MEKKSINQMSNKLTTQRFHSNELLLTFAIFTLLESVELFITFVAVAYISNQMMILSEKYWNIKYYATFKSQNYL